MAFPYIGKYQVVLIVLVDVRGAAEIGFEESSDLCGRILSGPNESKRENPGSATGRFRRSIYKVLRVCIETRRGFCGQSYKGYRAKMKYCSFRINGILTNRNIDLVFCVSK